MPHAIRTEESPFEENGSAPPVYAQPKGRHPGTAYRIMAMRASGNR